jgi:hypothetical protein
MNEPRRAAPTLDYETHEPPLPLRQRAERLRRIALWMIGFGCVVMVLTLLVLART